MKEPMLHDGEHTESDQFGEHRILSAIHETSNEHSKSKSQIGTLNLTQISNFKDLPIIPFKITEKDDDQSDMKKRS